MLTPAPPVDRWWDPWLDPWWDLVHGGACVGCARPGRSLCHGCSAALPLRCLEARPTPCPPGLVRCFAAGEYDGLLGRLVVAHKERSAFSLLGPLSQVLAAVVEPLVPDARTVLVPVPSRATTVRRRGHDPMLRVARGAAAGLRRRGLEVAAAGVLEQRFAVADQAGLDREQRATNLAGSMRVRAAARSALARADVPVALIVCDDVLTTGATAREAQRALEDSGLVVRAVATVAATRRRAG